jgi:hypothetical protein
MRISTSQYYDDSAANYQRIYSNVVATGQVVSSGVRVNTASDDPVGAARLLQLGQQSAMLGQYSSNIIAEIVAAPGPDGADQYSNGVAAGQRAGAPGEQRHLYRC